MASELHYAEVSPKERVDFISEAPDTGDPITYAVVNRKWKSDRPDSTPKITHSVTCSVCSEKSPWCYVVFALLFCAVFLLLMVVLLAVKCYSR